MRRPNFLVFFGSVEFQVINEITKALDVDDIQKADQELERLKTILGEENSEYKNMLQSIEDAKFIMEYEE